MARSAVAVGPSKTSHGTLEMAMHGDADIPVETIAPDDVSAVTRHRSLAAVLRLRCYV